MAYPRLLRAATCMGSCNLVLHLGISVNQQIKYLLFNKFVWCKSCVRDCLNYFYHQYIGMKDHADELCACQEPRTAAQRAGERRPRTTKISIITYTIIQLIDRNWLICKKIIFLAPKWINTLHECVYQILSENHKKCNWYSAK